MSDIDRIKIVCPKCGQVLSVPATTNLEGKNIVCPVCKNKAPFEDYRGGIKQNRHPVPNSTESTVVKVDTNYTLGKLHVTSLPPFQLHPGNNIIGRKSSASKATIQIPIDNKLISREHLLIKVQKVSGMGFVHYASIYKDHVNPTYINDVMLQMGDTIKLRSHDKIRLSDLTMEFIIHDEEETEI